MSTYAILEENVHHNIELPSGARLLFADITNLTKQQGFCWASNNYFASLYKKSRRCIQRWLKSLQDSGYIKIEIKDNFNRKIKLMINNENVTGVRQKCHRGYDKNVTPNNPRESSKETTNSEPKIAAVFSCLEEVEIPMADKKWLCRNFAESVILNAVHWAFHKSTKINKSLGAALKWACKAGIKANDDEADEKSNYDLAKVLEKKHVKGISFYHINSKGVEIGFTVSSSVIPVSILFSSRTFKEDLILAIKRFGVKFVN